MGTSIGRVSAVRSFVPAACCRLSALNCQLLPSQLLTRCLRQRDGRALVADGFSGLPGWLCPALDFNRRRLYLLRRQRTW